MRFHLSGFIVASSSRFVGTNAETDGEKLVNNKCYASNNTECIEFAENLFTCIFLDLNPL